MNFIFDMNLYFNYIFFGGLEFLKDCQENIVFDVIVRKISIILEKFKNDVEVLVGYIGEEYFIFGFSIEVILSEFFVVILRKCRRCEVYNFLVKYLREERNILLIIKSRR